MKENNILALIVAYYLSKFDTMAYEQLGFGSGTETHREIGRMLDVNPNSVKNMRDEFDPFHDNPRAGWYQRPLRPSRRRVVEAFQDLAEEELRDVILEILTNPDFINSEDLADIIEPISRSEKTDRREPVFIVRGPTGRKAEEIFINWYARIFPGELKDTRDLGCGYDFEISNNGEVKKVEVKGLDGETGGIVFTSKEWGVARKSGDTYHLIIVRNVSGDPAIQIIQNPARILSPRKNVFTTVQVRWNITGEELSKI